jgi:ribosome assembly protein 1
VEDFANVYAKKLGVRKETLLKTLWGDYYFNPKTKKIVAKNPTGKLVPMFVQFALQNIWEVYGAVANSQKDKLAKICSALQLKLTPRELDDAKSAAATVLSRWLPAGKNL